MEINGIPMHALAVHAGVVFAPLAAAVAVAYAVVPRWRWALRWPTLVLSVVAAVSVVLSYASGGSYLDARPELRQLPLIQLHEDRAAVLLAATLILLVVTVAAVFLLGGPSQLASGAGARDRRPAAVETSLAVLVVLAAVAVVVYAVLTGDAGARAKWG